MWYLRQTPVATSKGSKVTQSTVFYSSLNKFTHNKYMHYFIPHNFNYVFMGFCKFAVTLFKMFMYYLCILCSGEIDSL